MNLLIALYLAFLGVCFMAGGVWLLRTAWIGVFGP
jgi:hypothetical protein